MRCVIKAWEGASLLAGARSNLLNSIMEVTSHLCCIFERQSVGEARFRMRGERKVQGDRVMGDCLRGHPDHNGSEHRQSGISAVFSHSQTSVWANSLGQSSGCVSPRDLGSWLLLPSGSALSRKWKTRTPAGCPHGPHIATHHADVRKVLASEA